MTFFKLILAFLFSVFVAESRKITILNKCSFTIWPGIVGPGNPAGGGFRLDSGISKDIEVDDAWTGGYIWGRTECDKEFNCKTGFCINSEQCGGAGGILPITVAEFTLKAWGGQDFYDVSLVDGYNLPILINPIGQSGCNIAGGCIKDLNAECPPDLAVIGNNGSTVGCKTRCFANSLDDKECCIGDYATPDKCKPTPTTQLFKDACPTAYSYIFDDTAKFTCQSRTSYTVQFC